jgi:UV DNA damage endonuclease
MNLGYACINMTLSNGITKVTTNRSMVKKTFLEKGQEYAGSLALLNVLDLLTILKWNVKNGINFFRISSDIFPWASHYELKLLPQYNQIKDALFDIGLYAKEHKLRLTFHPGPFNVLTSPNDSVVKNTIVDLKVHGEICDLLSLSRSPFNKINIHCNGVYGDKKSAMDRFCSNFKVLPESVKERLTVENDDRPSMYSVKDLMYIHERIGIPIVFDYHHHKFCDGGLSEKDALELAISTWPKSLRPVVHYSESKSEHENDSKIKLQAHSDYINSLPKVYKHDLDVMVEAKAKELSILPFLN